MANLHQPEFVKLVSEDHFEFDEQFDREILSEVLVEIAQLHDDETLVWTPAFEIPVVGTYNWNAAKKVYPIVLQVVHGRVFLEKMEAREIAGEYFVNMEGLN